ncbi:hypothetical protein [Micromonospora sp. NPDC005367]|uniref:hypothetical protein n=1 Tax=Micromonospora sp. NPDC005367 TaxID=3155590 RepID=UPI0033BE5754
MSRRDCPRWCAPSPHDADGRLHRSAPLDVTTPAERLVLHIESYGSRTPYLTVAQYREPMDETDEPDFDADNMLMLKLPVAAELAAALATLVARVLGEDR